MHLAFDLKSFVVTIHTDTEIVKGKYALSSMVMPFQTHACDLINNQMGGNLASIKLKGSHGG